MKKLIISITLILILIGGFLLFSFCKNQNINEQSVFYSDQLSNINEIIIESTGPVSLTSSNSNELKSSLLGDIKSLIPTNYPKLISRIEDKTLIIKDSKVNDHSGIIGYCNLNLSISIPESYKNKVSVKTATGAINISNIYSEDIECRATSGTTCISTKKLCGHIKAMTSTGKIELRLPKEDKFNLSSKTKTGSLKNELNGNVDNSLKDKTIDVSTTSGDISLYSPN